MIYQVKEQQNLLSERIERYCAGLDGVYQTEISSLFFNRQSRPTLPIYGISKPSLCIVAQGVKDVWFSQEHLRYGPSDYLVASLNLPVIGQIAEATVDLPYLSLKLEISSKQILEVLSHLKPEMKSEHGANHPIFINPVESSLLDAVNRLIQLLDSPRDISMLAPLIKKEIIYRILQGRYGENLGRIAIEGSYTYHIQSAVEELMGNFQQTFRIQDLAEKANMSISSFHRYFKIVTGMSPIQFQKKLRLYEARRLLLSESADATEAAFQVGYESPSQFSREYSRMFHLPPKQDVKRIKETYHLNK